MSASGERGRSPVRSYYPVGPVSDRWAARRLGVREAGLDSGSPFSSGRRPTGCFPCRQGREPVTRRGNNRRSASFSTARRFQNDDGRHDREKPNPLPAAQHGVMTSPWPSFQPLSLPKVLSTGWTRRPVKPFARVRRTLTTPACPIVIDAGFSPAARGGSRPLARRRSSPLGA